MQNILVAIDFSDLTDLVVRETANLGAMFGATVRLLHVAAPDPGIASSRSWPQEVRDELARELHNEHKGLEKIAQRLEDQQIDVKAMLQRGEIVDTILDVARKTETDLIILGSRPRGAFFDLLPGSVVKGVIRKAACKVLVVPGKQPAKADAAGRKPDARQAPA